MPDIKEMWAATRFFVFMFAVTALAISPALFALKVTILILSHIRISFEP